MSTNTDLEKEIAKRMVKEGAKIMVAEAKGATQELTGEAKMMQDTLNELVQKQMTMKLHLFRIDSFNAAADPKYVSTIDNLNPQLVLEQGLHATVKAWCGGGKYRIRIQAPGVQTVERTIDIEGEPFTPLPERKPGSPTGLLPTNVPGQYVAGPGFAGMLGFQTTTPNLGDATANKAMNAMEQMTTLLLAKVLSGEDRRPQVESDDLRQAKEQIAELRRERDLVAANAAHEKQIAELRSQMERLSQAQSAPPKEDMLSKAIQLAVATIPAVIQAKTASDAKQSDLLLAILARDSKKEDPIQAELLKAVLARPSSEDQLMKVYESMGGIMSTTVGLTQGVINQMASLQGGERPWWQDMLMNLAGEIGNVAQTVMSRGKVVPGQIVEAETETDVDRDEIESAASAASAAARKELDSPGQAPQLAGFVGPSRGDSAFTSDSFVKIFELIEDGHSSPHEIAFRVWKHATSGDAAALEWMRDHEGYTGQLLLGFVQRGEMELTQERYDAIVSAMADLVEHFRQGGTPDAYVAHFGIKLSLPKKIHIVPVRPATEDELKDEEGHDESPEDVGEAASQPASRQEEENLVAMPGFDRIPLPPGPDTSIPPTPGLDRLPGPPRPDSTASPMPSAAQSIPVEPKS